MRILHTADWHLGKTLEGVSRLKEQEEFLEDFVRIAEEKRADLILIAGDVFDTVNPSAQAERLFYRTLKRLSADGERLTVVIAGNHDNPQRLSAASPLASDHGILICGTPKTILMTGAYGKHEVTEAGEGYVRIRIREEEAVVLTVPFPSEKRLNEILYGQEEEEQECLASYSDRLRQLFDGLKVHFQKDTVNLIVSHLFVMQSAEGGSERSISLGGSYLVSPSIFPPEAQYTALGHIHKPQIVPQHPSIRYSGSPLPYHRGEAAYQKQVLYVEVRAGEEAVIEPIPLRNYKPIEVWKCGSVTQAIERCEAESEREAYVYLEIETDRVILESEIRSMKLMKQDILEIHPIFTGNGEEERQTEQRQKSFGELFMDFYKKEKGADPSEETLNMLYSLINEEVDHEAVNTEAKGTE